MVIIPVLITNIDHDISFISYLGPPNLRDNLMYRIVENTLNVPVDLSQYPPPFPEPRNFTWTRNTVTLSNPTLTHSSITFPSVRRSDTGNYVVSATNFVLDNERVQIGSDTGSFTLDVICKTMFADLLGNTLISCHAN